MIIYYLSKKDIIDKGGVAMVIQADERIKELRLSRGLTQTELAKIMSVTRSSVNAWELGISVPTAAKLVELSLFFHVSTDYLLGLEAKEGISLDGLDEEQREIIYSLLTYFEKRRWSQPGPEA
jgi:transcriptional regulator with XRE-family HTH domain